MVKMAEQKAVAKKKGKVKAEAEMTVKSYQRDIGIEKQKMGTYSKKFGTTVRSLQADFKSLQADFKKCAADFKKYAKDDLGVKVARFKKDIQDQIKENKQAVAHMAGNISFFLREINKKKKDFESYAKLSFWGVGE